MVSAPKAPEDLRKSRRESDWCVFILILRLELLRNKLRILEINYHRKAMHYLCGMERQAYYRIRIS